MQEHLQVDRNFRGIFHLVQVRAHLKPFLHIWRHSLDDEMLYGIINPFYALKGKKSKTSHIGGEYDMWQEKRKNVLAWNGAMWH